MNENIKEKLKHLPSLPGVYIMKDKSGNIIYVGKAKVLKNRVRQYFHDSAKHSDKVASMVLIIHDFEYIITDTEFEALCLECNLIKKNKPKYNILLKDDKHYPYIKITNEDYPRIVLARKILDDKAKYFGPYPSATVIRDTIDVLRKIFKIQHCNKIFPRDIGKERPCLYHAMGRCDAPCIGNIKPYEYKETFKEICNFLEGKHGVLIEDLKKGMLVAADNLEFERAAQFRNKIDGINKIADRQKVITDNKENIDVFAVSIDDDIAVFEIFYVRGGKLIGNSSYKQNNMLTSDEGSALSDFIKAYYLRDVLIPETVISAHTMGDTGSIEKWLSEKKGKRVKVKIPQKGDFKKLVDMTVKNAKQALSDYKIEILSKNNKENALSELAKEIGLSEKPKRIEAYDISNTSGSENVGSMVVFINGQKATNEYKRFKIKYIVGSNDYECMKEILVRRFLRYHSNDEKFNDLPSLILIDGGKGHVSAAKEALHHLGIDVKVFGMVKNEHHRTRGLIGEDGEILLKPGGSAFRLITHIQDEAHRFAITYHKNLRGKKTFASELENIQGVGPSKRKILIKHFKSLEKIKNASLEELKEVQGIDSKTAQNIYDFFRVK